MDGTGTEMTDNYCKGARPSPDSVPCSMPACPAVMWVATYGPCVATCGNGNNGEFSHKLSLETVVCVKLVIRLVQVFRTQGTGSRCPLRGVPFIP